MKKLVLAVDLDGIVVDLHTEWLRLYNEEHNHGVTLDDIKSYAMEKNVKIGTKIYDYLAHPGLYLRVKPLPGAVEALQILKEQGHEIHIVTAASKADQTAADKLTWCRKHLPFVHRRFVTISHQKHRFFSDIFIDDSPTNLEEHAEAQPNAVRMGIAWPYNACVAQYMAVRAESYRDTLGAWARLLEAINEQAKA